MQINPHQIPHFARQMERIKQMREDWNSEPKEKGSYFSERFVGVNQFVNWLSSKTLDAYHKAEMKVKLDLLMNGIGIENNIKGLRE